MTTKKTNKELVGIDPDNIWDPQAPTELTDLNNYIPGVLTWVYNRLSSDASRSYRHWYDLGVTDWRVLAYLGVNKHGTAANISRIVNLDKAATSRSIAFLKDKGLLVTEQLPGRNIRLSLTQEGMTRFREVAVLALDREQALLKGFSTGERQMLNEMLHRMLTNLDAVAQVVPRSSLTTPHPHPGSIDRNQRDESTNNDG